MVSLKKIIQEITSEGAENMRGYSFTHETAVGPFVIFKDNNNQPRYAFTKKGTDGYTTLDTGEISSNTESPYESGDTHGTSLNAVRHLTGIELDRNDFDNVIQGRIWKIGNVYYVGMWSVMNQLQHFGVKGFVEKLKELFRSEIGVTNEEKIIIEPYHNRKDSTTYVSLYDLEHYGHAKQKDDIEQQTAHQAHTLSPEEKAKYLRAKGAQPRISATTDWMKKTVAGVDESYLLSEVVKGIILEGKASSFLKFYSELKRGYNPNNATLFDCLMTLRDYYRDYIGWYQAYPIKKREDREVYPHFIKRLQEIETALHSDDIRRKIIAVDNGINQWHIDYPVVYHLQMGAHPKAPENIETDQWYEIGELLKTLGKLPEQSPYIRHIKL